MEALADPKKNRQVKSVKPPPARPLTSKLIFDDPKNPSKLNRHSKLESDS